MACYTQEEIAKDVGCPRTTIETILTEMEKLPKPPKAYPSFDGISLCGMNLVDCRNTDVYNSQLIIKSKSKKW